MGNIQANEKHSKTGKSPGKSKHFIRNLNRKSPGKESKKRKKSDIKRDVVDREFDKTPDSDNAEAIEASDNDTIECAFVAPRGEDVHSEVTGRCARSPTRGQPTAASPEIESTSDSVFTDPLTPLAVELNQCYYSAESDSAHEDPASTLTPSQAPSSPLVMPHDTASLLSHHTDTQDKVDGFADTDRSDEKVMGAIFTKPRAEVERNECNHDFRDNRLKASPGQTSFTLSKHRKVEIAAVACEQSLAILDNDQDRRHASLSDVPIESNVLRKVASLTLDKHSEGKVVRPRFVPEKLDFQLYEKFEGQMLLNWFQSSISENNHLKNLVSSPDLKNLGIQYCTYLLAAGVLRQIADKDAPTENVFKPNLMYYWAHMEIPASQPVTPGRLQKPAWPPDKELISQENITNRYSLENSKCFNQNNNEEINDINEARLIISQLKRKLEETEYQLEKHKINAQIDALNKNLEKSFDLTGQYQSCKNINVFKSKEIQTSNSTNEINKISYKPVINIPDTHSKTNVNIDNILVLSSSAKEFENKSGTRSEKIENYCKLNKSRDYNETYQKDDTFKKSEDIESKAYVSNEVKKNSDHNTSISVACESSSDASFHSTVTSNELISNLNESEPDRLNDVLILPKTLPKAHTTVILKEPTQQASQSLNDFPNETSHDHENVQLLIKTDIIHSPSSPPTKQCTKELPSPCQSSPSPPPPQPGMSPQPPPMPGTGSEEPLMKTEAVEHISHNSPMSAIESPLSKSDDITPPFPQPELTLEEPPLRNISPPAPSMAPSPPESNLGTPSPPTLGISPQPTLSSEMGPPPTPMPEIGSAPIPGIVSLPPPMPEVSPPPPPMPGMGPPPPPMPGMGPPPPPLPGMGPPPPPMPGMGPPPPPMPGMGPPPPPMQGIDQSGTSGPCPPPPPSMLGSIPIPPPASGPVPFPAPPVGGWGMQRSTLRKTAVKPTAPMKPLYWTRIIANPNRPLPSGEGESDTNNIFKPLWLEIDETNLDNIDEFIDLFSRQVIKAPVKKKVEVKTKIQPVKILDSKRSQNVGILAQSLHVEFSEIENAIYNFDTSVVSLEALQQIYELRASEEELCMIKEHLNSKPQIPLDRPESFLHDLSGIPNFAERITCFMFQADFEDAISTTMHKLDNLKHTCEFLTTSENLKTLFAIILTLGNYMNGGNGQRGQADGFGLEILAKLKDVKSKQSNVTLLHFIVRTYMRTCGGALSDGCTLPVPEPGDVVRAAALDFADVAASLDTLDKQLSACKEKTQKVLETDAQTQGEVEESSSPSDSKKRLDVFKDKMSSFLNAAEDKLKTETENLEDCRNKFAATIKFYQYTPKCGKIDECEPKEFFSLWTTFCSDFKDIYKKEEQIAIKEKLKEAKKLQEERKSLTQPKKEGGLKARLQKLSRK